MPALRDRIPQVSTEEERMKLADEKIAAETAKIDRTNFVSNTIAFDAGAMY